MHRTKAMLCVCFCAGLLGALVASFIARLGANLGIQQLAEVLLPAHWSLAWLYPQLIWGGLWGLAYFATVASPRARNHWVRKGLWASLLPTAWQLFYLFPNHTPHGALGLGLGNFTPVVFLVYYLIWGFFTGLFARVFWGRS